MCTFALAQVDYYSIVKGFEKIIKEEKE